MPIVPCIASLDAMYQGYHTWQTLRYKDLDEVAEITP